MSDDPSRSMVDGTIMRLTDDETHALLDREVALLGAPASSQKEWLTARDYPVDELAQQFFESLRTLVPRLRRSGHLDFEVERRLRELKHQLEGFLTPERHELWTEDGLTDFAPECQEVRHLAHEALACMRR